MIIILDQRRWIAHTCDAHETAVAIGFLDTAHQRRIAPVAPTDDADPIRIGDALLDEVGRTVGEVVDRGAPRAKSTLARPIAAIATGAPVVAL